MRKPSPLPKRRMGSRAHVEELAFAKRINHHHTCLAHTHIYTYAHAHTPMPLQLIAYKNCETFIVFLIP